MTYSTELRGVIYGINGYWSEQINSHHIPRPRATHPPCHLTYPPAHRIAPMPVSGASRRIAWLMTRRTVCPVHAPDHIEDARAMVGLVCWWYALGLTLSAQETA